MIDVSHARTLRKGSALEGQRDALYKSTTTTKKVKSNYFIVLPKVDQRAGLLLPHLGNFHRTATFTTSAFTS